MKKLLQEYIKLQISKILSEGFYENPMTTMQDVLGSFSGRTLIFFDTETTGLRGTNSFSQIIEIAAVAFDDQAKQLGQYHYKTKLNPEVLKRIEEEKDKKRKQQVIDSRREEVKNYKKDLTKLQKVLKKISSEIKSRIGSEHIQISLEELRNKLFVKIANLINPPEKKSLKSAIKESVEFDMKKKIKELISEYQILTSFLTSIPSDSPLETEKQISKEIKRYLEKIQNLLLKIEPEENEWEQNWKSIEDILDMTQYHELNAKVISEREALQGFKQFIDSFTKPLLIAHNARFDMMQINNGMKRYNLGYIPKDIQVLDTVKLFKNYINPLLTILKGGNPTEETKRLIVALSFQTKDIKEMDIQQYKEFIDKQNIEDIYKNVTTLFGSLKHLTVGLNVELKNWHSAVADAEALSKVLLNFSQIMSKYKHFEQKFKMQRKRAEKLGNKRQREIEIEKAKQKKRQREIEKEKAKKN